MPLIPSPTLIFPILVMSSCGFNHGANALPTLNPVSSSCDSYNHANKNGHLDCRKQTPELESVRVGTTAIVADKIRFQTLSKKSQILNYDKLIKVTASLTQWIWVWEKYRRQWRTGKPGVLQSIGWQRIRRDFDWTTATVKSEASLRDLLVEDTQLTFPRCIFCLYHQAHLLFYYPWVLLLLPNLILHITLKT